jgi:diguanylate cyclase (GGDEF)-like protein/PAS domain S-box-containing protein
MEAPSSTGHTVRIMFDDSPIGMCSVMADGAILRGNPAFAKITGVGGGSVLVLVDGPERAELSRALLAIAGGEERSFKAELRLTGRAGRWCEISGAKMRGGSGDVMLHLVDVTERRVREEQLRYLAERDPLTALYNRHSFHRVLGERIAAGTGGSVLMLDLDGFKAVNDTCGHQRGDGVLVAVAAAIRDAMPAAAIVARLGGDEFAVLLDVDERAAAALATRLITAITIAAATQIRAPRVSASIGIAALTAGCELNSVLAVVDRAMYAAKRAGKARCQVALSTDGDGPARHAYSA